MTKLIAQQFKSEHHKPPMEKGGLNQRIFLSMQMMKEIKNEADYNNVMAKIDSLMAKGSGNVSKDELAEIRSLAQSVQGFEQAKYVIEAPTTLIGMIEMRMYEMKLRQRDLA